MPVSIRRRSRLADKCNAGAAVSATAEELAETPDKTAPFPGSPRISSHACRPRERVAHACREVLFREGDEQYDFHVVLDGKVAVFEDQGGPHERLIAVHGPRRFLGELGLLTVRRPSSRPSCGSRARCSSVPVDRLRALLSQDSALGDLMLRAYFVRRELLIGLGAGFRIIGSRFSPRRRRCASSSPATACRIGGSISSRMQARRRCSASSASRRRRPRWSSGAAR